MTHRRSTMRRAMQHALLISWVLLSVGGVAHAFEYYAGNGMGVQVHGAYEMQLRTISDGFREDRWYLSQWSNVLDIEAEFDIAPDGFAFFDFVSGFARVEGRIECVYKYACGTSTSYNLYGGSAKRQPRNFTNGTTSGYSGTEPDPLGVQRVHGKGGRLVEFTEIPPFDRLFSLGANPEAIALIEEPIEGALFAVRKIDYDNPRGPRILPQGPWRTGYNLQSLGTLAGVPDFTNPADPDPTDDDVRGGLLLRPRFEKLYAPSWALAERADRFGPFDQEFSENDLFFNHGASQDEWVLREAYLDLEMFESRLWLRLGKQSIVWGKTELFRTTDQLNPQDIAISSLPSLEESRIPLWSARAVWSFYDVGPFQDVRLEGAVILDDFEPADLGFCGEPYTPWPVCGKSFGLFAHGISHAGLAGEERPPNWWEDASGLEVGARLEWRWERFSFALTDFWGYNDFPYLETFNVYERKVDPDTGRPLDVFGRGFDTSGVGDPTITDDEYLTMPGGDKFVKARDKLRNQAYHFHPSNRQFYDVVCGFTVGIATALIDNPALEDACILDLLNNVNDLGLLPGTPVSAGEALSMVLAGTPAGVAVASLVSGTGAGVPLVPLNRDPADSNPNYVPANPPACYSAAFRVILNRGETPCLSDYLTDEQEALLGCGPFYGTDCDLQGVDLFNTEFSVLGQRLPNIEKGSPIATRVVFRNGQRKTIQIPGSRSIYSKFWDPFLDGCVRPDPGAGSRINPKERFCQPPTTPNGPGTENDLLAMGYESEMEALSENFVRILAALGSTDTDNPANKGCAVDKPENCELVRAVTGLSGVQRPEISARRNQQFGRRDWVFHGGGEAVLRYNKRNVLGFSMDFAEDVTKTNWSMEFTWIPNERFGSAKVQRGNEALDVYNLTVSVDRLTFINFLNANRTFFINSQWFFRYIDDFGDDRIRADGPFSVLGTLTVGTGYFQDRLTPAVTFVHDVSSASGAVIAQVGYRYTEALSVTFGVAGFYGGPRREPIPDYPLQIGNEAPPYNQRTKYQGLSAIAERDEIFMRLRYTF